ncbi:hypothetical protein Rleg9DRAFT_6533 [Rhizobium leguminosarum bv. trifolii WSM597]|uniref:Uncharacterized protein n=1 Tax=Rhizobium leguminosarum bv. trifolii WSM597 TaxID=754764 RepID=I9NHT8_RHILT|nr:hypothetical protein [Rhizobium leguminosarum]EJB07519.1 hypothetical protein Rleg9DRAFT_6533 [Rhizobium leguminosarum bv. trifolii WSM597]
MQQSARERHQALLKGKETLTESLAGLRSEQSAALINGTEFAHGADIRALTDDIEALDGAIEVVSADADAEEVRQRATSNIERRQQDLQQFDGNSERWLTIVADIEAAVSTAVEGLAELHTLASEMETFALPVSGERLLPALNHQNIGIRMSERMARKLAPLDPASVGAFGIIRWQPRPGMKEDWVAEERSQLAGLIGHIKRMSEKYIAEQSAIAQGE